MLAKITVVTVSVSIYTILYVSYISMKLKKKKIMFPMFYTGNISQIYISVCVDLFGDPQFCPVHLFLLGLSVGHFKHCNCIIWFDIGNTESPNFPSKVP